MTAREQQLEARVAELEAREARILPVHKFLLGEGPLNDHWFGEKPKNARGNFWWRKYLKAALEGK